MKSSNLYVRRRESGNVLFLILIAVALFAALSYAITHSNRGGGTSVKNEKDTIDAAVANDCEARINSAVLRLQMTNGCATSQISYQLPSGDNANPQAPADKHCHLFHPGGAGAAPCGSHLLVASVTLGTVIAGNTSTIARLTSGPYLKCNSWTGTGNKSCNVAMSLDGSSFSPARQSTCLFKNDGSARGFSAAMSLQPTLANSICSASCAGTASSSNAYSGTGATYYVEDDLSLTPYSGSCGYSLENVVCSCW